MECCTRHSQPDQLVRAGGGPAAFAHGSLIWLSCARYFRVNIFLLKTLFKRAARKFQRFAQCMVLVGLKLHIACLFCCFSCLLAKMHNLNKLQRKSSLCKTTGYLKSQLADYISNLQRVRLIRTNKREGLVRARLIGATYATGDVLTFLDCHCECVPGWIEPLLERCVDHLNRSVSPYPASVVYFILFFPRIPPAWHEGSARTPAPSCAP